MAGLVTRDDLYLRAQIRNGPQVKRRAQSSHECMLPAGAYHGAAACKCNGKVLHAMLPPVVADCQTVAVQRSIGQVCDCLIAWDRVVPRKDHDA